MGPWPIDADELEEIRRHAAEVKPLYLRAWHDILERILGWPAQTIDRWATKWEEKLNGVEDYLLFYHETPAYYVVNLLVPPTLRSRLNFRERMQLESRLEEAINSGRWPLGFDPDHEFPLDYDWQAAKSRADAILMEYGERLPQTEEEIK